MKRIFNNVYVVQALLFLAVNFMYLLSRSVLWDGKLWYQLMHNHDFDGLFWMTYQSKLPIVFHLYTYLGDTFNPTFMAKAISFFSFLFAGLIFRWFLEKDQIGSVRGRFLAGFWFCLMPCYLVGIEFCHVSYNVAVLVFFLGCFLHAATLEEHERPSVFIPIHLLVFGCFYFAFTANKAFLFLYPLFIVASVFRFYKKSPFKKFLLLWTKKYWFLLLIPFIYWTLKDQPHGVYDNYNAINFRDTGRFIEAFKIGLQSNRRILSKILSWVFHDGVLLGLAVVWFLVLWWTCKAVFKTATPAKNSPRFLILGLAGSFVLLLMIIFPYAAVGKHAQFMDFESRHALLFVFPQALMIAFAVALAEQKLKQFKFVFLGALAFISLVTAAVFENFRRNDVDWFKRQAMIENFKISKAIQNASIIGIQDNILEWNQLNRGIEFYELSAFAQDALGNQRHLVYDTRFPVDKALLETPGVPQRYQFKDYDPKGQAIVVEMNRGEVDLLSWKNYLQLKWSEMFDEEEFRLLIVKAIQFKD